MADQKAESEQAEEVRKRARLYLIGEEYKRLSPIHAMVDFSLKERALEREEIAKRLRERAARINAELSQSAEGTIHGRMQRLAVAEAYEVLADELSGRGSKGKDGNGETKS
jgi:hypothetical protein